MKDIHMFGYLKDKKGLCEAVKDYYPDTLAKDPAIAAALVQIENGERAILARVEELTLQHPYQDETTGAL
jgi:hypothetical protein